MLAGALALAVPLAAAAQSSAVRARVTDRVDLSRLTTLRGNTHPLARAQYDQGAAPPDLPMNRILLVLKRSSDQEAALQDLLVQQQVTGSASYHKWVTPDQFGQQFGPADADIQAVTGWLTSYGFQSIKVSKGRTVVEFSGTAAQVQSALHTEIHKYVVNGEAHWANASDPQIPTALTPVISGFASLHNFPRKRPLVRSGQKAPAVLTPGAKPLVTFTDGSHGVAPADFNVIYNVASGMTGAGVTIAVVSDTDINVQDVDRFRSIFGLPSNDPQTVLNGPDPGDIGDDAEEEAVLDVTWAGAVAPNATVKLVVSEDTNDVNGVDLSEVYIVENNLADVMTESILLCEADASSNAAFYSSLAEQAAAQGITYLVASGDGGPDGCDDFSTVPTVDAPPSVNILASTPFTIAVGGTEFNDTASPNTYWQSASGTNGESAKSYIPENVWNESCTALSATCAVIGLWSSGGGQSAVFLAKPPWQSGVAGIPTANARFLPDVSLNAANHDGYVVCYLSSCASPNPEFYVFSGTSASAQAFGGIMALVVQQAEARQGLANYVLYKLAASETLSSCNGSSTTTPPISTCVFNDITSGNTNIPGETGFPASIGYDEATGLGSVNVSNLVNNWASARVSASTTTLSLNGGAAVNVTHGTAVPVSITVSAKSPATGTPTGDVSLISTSSTWKGTDGFTLSSGSVNASTILLPGGTYTVTAHYEGDGTFTGSNSTPPVSVTVSPESSVTGVGIVIGFPCTLSTSVAYGSSYILSGGVTDSTASGTVCLPSPRGAFPTGTVTLTDTFNGNTNPLDGGTFTLNSAGYFEDQTIQLPAGVHSIRAVYNGDNSFGSSTSTSDVVTVTQATTATSVAASQTTVASGTPVTLTATVSTQSNATANASQEPTGTVQFYLGGTAFGNPVTVTGGVNSSTGFAQAVAVDSNTTLASGANVITAKYLGDSNYAASAISSGVTVTVGSAGINLSPGCSSATITIGAPGQSGSCLITVTGANGFNGTVALSAAVTGAPASAVDSPTCSFGAPDSNFTAPSTIALSTTSETGNATMTCSSTAASEILFGPSNHPSGRNWLLAVVAVALALFFLVVPKQRRWKLVPLAVLVAVVVTAGVSCGGGGSSGGGSGGGNPGTTVGAYTVTVTATPSVGTAQSTAVTVNVQ